MGERVCQPALSAEAKRLLRRATEREHARTRGRSPLTDPTRPVWGVPHEIRPAYDGQVEKR